MIKTVYCDVTDESTIATDRNVLRMSLNQKVIIVTISSNALKIIT